MAMTPAERAAIVLHDRLRKVASLPWLLDAGKKVIETIKAIWYLGDVKLYGQTYSYGNFTGKRIEPLAPDEIEMRMHELEAALEEAEREIPESKEVIDWFRSILKK